MPSETQPPTRDYSMKGASTNYAEFAGWDVARWYKTPIERELLKTLSERRDAPAIKDTIIWLGSLIILGTLTVALWSTAWVFPVLLMYGVLYGSAGDSRWHECGHGTAFHTPWMNTAVYHIACFMMIRNPVAWRWSHTRHHRNTVIVGRDPEIALMRPPDLLKLVLNLFGIPDTLTAVHRMYLHTKGQLHPDEAEYIPASQAHKAFRIARIWIGVYALTILIAIVMRSWIPIVLIGLPRLYGAWHHVMTGLLQHGGLADNVFDYRLNTRTVLMNPINRFIYWNMNYHTEHHMFPNVPYHALPKLHEAIKYDLPAANTSIWNGYREMLPILVKQLSNHNAFIKKSLPSTAARYKINNF